MHVCVRAYEYAFRNKYLSGYIFACVRMHIFAHVCVPVLYECVSVRACIYVRRSEQGGDVNTFQSELASRLPPSLTDFT